MSFSEPTVTTDPLDDAAVELEAGADRLLAEGAAPSEESLRRVVTAAARLHARYTEAVRQVDPLRHDVSPTEAVDLACGVLRSRDLNPFDLAPWFSRPA